MTKIIRLTEQDIRYMVHGIARKIKESYSPEELSSMSDEDYNNILNQFTDSYEKEDLDFKDYIDSNEADLYNPEDAHFDLSDGDLYR